MGARGNFYRELPGTKIVRLIPRPAPRLPGKKSGERVVLLQGPVGTFFRQVQAQLDAQGHDAWRICFHAGDRFFARKSKCIGFHGNLAEWQRWFSDFVFVGQVDRIILFGAERPAHRAARAIAAEAGIPVVALEEGYVRPGYITAEAGGNNAGSPLAGQLPPPAFVPFENQGKGEEFRRGARRHVNDALYYALRNLLTFGKARQLFHRELSLLPEGFFWCRNLWRLATGQARNFATIQQLLEHRDKAYFLVPLQVDADSQLKESALGWTQLGLISATLKSFATTAPADRSLVFKIHPLDRGHSNHAVFIAETAKAYGLEHRVFVIDTGSLGLLTRHCAGMITINSTSGLSALYHGVPLLVVGQALYAHPALATCAHGKPDFDAFWRGGHVAPRELRAAYLAWIRQETLLPGDYYAPKGIKPAVANLVAALPRFAAARNDSKEAKTA